MAKKLFFSLLINLFIINLATAQTGSISGTIKTSDAKPAEFVTISIKGLPKVTMSDTAGKYFFKEIKAGTYLLIASFSGLDSREQTVNVVAGQNIPADFVLSENKKELTEVVVKSGWNKFAQRKSDYIARMPLKPLENAQVYNTITKELAQEQSATDFKSILKNAPGVSGASTTNPIMGRSQLMIRGFSQVFTLKNGMYVNSNFAPDPVTIEKLDIVKGPSATLFGAATYLGMSYGGFVNQQTKKPYDSFGGEVSYSGGSYGLNRLTSDVNIPLNEDKTVLFRLNTALQSENNFKYYGYGKSYVINPSILYKVNDKLTVRAELDIQYNKLAGGVSINPLSANVTAKNWKDINMDYRSSYGSDDLPSTTKYYDIYLQAEYRFAKNWTSQTSYMINSFNLDWLLLSVNLISDSTLRRTGSSRLDHNTMTTVFQQNFVGDFKIGNLRNRLLIGGDYTGGSDLKQTFYGKTFTVDTVNYRRKREQTISHYDFQAKSASAGFDNYGGRAFTNAYGVYICDVLNLTDNLLVMAGIRYNYYEDRTKVDILGSDNYPQNSQSAFSPKFGIVYQPIKDRISVFANYQNGLTNQFAKDFYGKQFKPEQANQLEFGIKTELAEGLSSSISYYDIKVTDKLRTDVDHVGFSVQDANQSSKGVEADIIYNPLPGLNLLAGYGHNKSKFTKANANIEGKTPSNVPGNVANFWTSYQSLKGKTRGWGIGFGGNYTSQAFTDDGNTFVIPAYTLFDATIFYNVSKYRLGIKCNNVANTKSWNRWGSQPLRQFVANFTVKF